MSWQELLAIEREREAELDRQRSEPPRACPNDGEVLLEDPKNGGLRCPFDGWQWPDDA